MPISELNTDWKGKDMPKLDRGIQEKDGTKLDLKINPIFEKLIPPLSGGEIMELHGSLRNEGCRDALVIWNGTIVDGHNRYKYCKRKGIAFKVIERHFADEKMAKVWIIDNQLARRNLTKGAKIRLENMKKDILSDGAQARMKSGKKMEVSDELWEEYQRNLQKNSKGAYDIDPSPKLGQGSEKGKVSTHIAKSAGVGRGTVEMFNYIEAKDPKLADALCTGSYDEHGNKITIGGVYKDLKEKERKQKLHDEGSPIGRYAIAYMYLNSCSRASSVCIKELMQDDSLLFLWSFIRNMKESITRMEHWGFKYTDMIIWDFVRPCDWAYTDSHHMFLLIGVRGDSTKHVLKIGDKFPAVITQDREDVVGFDLPRPPHDTFKSLISQKFPALEKLDYFGTETTKEWDIYHFQENNKKLTS